MKIYISGPITLNDTADEVTRAANIRRFYLVEERLLGEGHEPLNPCRNEAPGRSYADYIRLDIALVLSADAIHLLPQWKTSRGSCLEFDIATAIGLLIRYEPE